MFSDKIIDAAIHTIEKSDALKSLIKYNFEKKKLAYKNSTDEESVYDDVFLNNVYKRSLGLVYLPFSEAKKIVNKLPAHLNRKGVNILVWNALSGTFAILLKKKFPKANIVCAEYFDYFKNHLKRSGFATPEVNKNFVIDNSSNCDIFKSKDYKNMKFDVVIGNPPYQAITDGNSRAIWHKFIIKSRELLKKDGYLCMIHPAGWRDVGGVFSDVKEFLLSKQMEYLEIHNEKDGLRTFGANTRYDWYILKNADRTKNYKTHVRFEDGSEQYIDLVEIPFIPNNRAAKINNLLAKPNEQRVEIINNSSYHRQKSYVNDVKTNEFKYPLIYHVSKNTGPVLNWSSVNNLGHFNIPKIIWGNSASTGFYLDETGEYGMTQFAYALVDTVDNLKKIIKVLDKHYDEISSMTNVVGSGLNHKVLSLFRKDFWKDFL
jgi:hypothetical protein